LESEYAPRAGVRRVSRYERKVNEKLPVIRGHHNGFYQHFFGLLPLREIPEIPGTGYRIANIPLFRGNAGHFSDSCLSTPYRLIHIEIYTKNADMFIISFIKAPFITNTHNPG
jgi:hypothetical protein